MSPDRHPDLTSEISATSFTEAVTLTESDAAINAVKFGGRTVRAGLTTVRDFGGDPTVALAETVLPIMRESLQRAVDADVPIARVDQTLEYAELR